MQAPREATPCRRTPLKLDARLDDGHHVPLNTQMTTAVLMDCDRCGPTEALHEDCDACYESSEQDTSAFERCQHYVCRSCGMAL